MNGAEKTRIIVNCRKISPYNTIMVGGMCSGALTSEEIRKLSPDEKTKNRGICAFRSICNHNNLGRRLA